MWEKAKAPFIERFGGLIYEWPEPVEFILDPMEKKRKALEFIECVSCTFDNIPLADFLDLNIDTFFENKVSKSENKDIPEGMKLIKAFKFFESNKQALRDMQDIASQLIQENSVKGTLCFSVHPLDFLSSSENTYNWRSCHALDGEFRAGNLSYMVDNATFMVYLKGADKEKLPNFPMYVPWNSKKWRMLLHMEEAGQRLMIAGRQYPMEIDGARDLVKDMINQLKIERYNYTPPFNDHSFVAWNDEHFNSFTSSDLSNPEEVKYTTKPYRYINGLISAMSTFVKTPKSQTLHYNDVLLSHVYPYPHVTWETNRSFGIVPKVHIGYDGVPCVCCGEEPICNSETFACRSCNCADDSYCCDYCGSSVDEDELMYVDFDDSYICQRCFHEHYLTCVNCGYTMPRHDAIFNTEIGDFVCQVCNFEANEISSGTTQNITPVNAEQTIHQAVRAIPIDYQAENMSVGAMPE
jgi:hypothetical protein